MQVAMLKIEENWLQSINAPVNVLPDYVVQAVATRILLSGIPIEYTQRFIADMQSRQQDGKTNGNDRGMKRPLSATIQSKISNRIISTTGKSSGVTIPGDIINSGLVTDPAFSLDKQQEAGDNNRFTQSPKEALEYNTALRIVDYFRSSLATIGYLGLSDEEMLKVTRQALKGNSESNSAAWHISNWLDGEFSPFKPSLQMVFGDHGVSPELAIADEIEHYSKEELLRKTNEVIEDFRKQLAGFGWSGLLYDEVFKAARLALKISSFDEVQGKIDDALQPIAWHIHVMLQEAEYAQLKPILEEGLKSTAREVRRVMRNMVPTKK